MGVMIRLTCPKCGLESGTLFVGGGFSGKYYEVAWCGRCRRFAAPPVAAGRGFDRSEKPAPRCLRCGREMLLLDTEPRSCPLCGAELEETLEGFWD